MSAFGAICEYTPAVALDIVTIPYRGAVSTYKDLREDEPNSSPFGAFVATAWIEFLPLTLSPFALVIGGAIGGAIGDAVRCLPIGVIGGALSGVYSLSILGNCLSLAEGDHPILPRANAIYAKRKSSIASSVGTEIMLPIRAEILSSKRLPESAPPKRLMPG